MFHEVLLALIGLLTGFSITYVWRLAHAVEGCEPCGDFIAFRRLRRWGRSLIGRVA